MRDVAIIGIGHTKFGKAEKTQIELFAEAAMQAMEDASVDRKQIEALFIGSVLPMFEEGQGMTSAYSVSELGLGSIPSTRFEGACASSTIALRDAYMWVGSGQYDIVLAGGLNAP